MTEHAPSREGRNAPRRTFAGSAPSEGALNNDGLSAKQKRRLGASARALIDLANATGKAVKGKKKKAVRALNKLLKLL